MRKIVKWTFRGLFGLVVLIVVAGTVLFFWLRTSQPRLDGRVAVAGLQQPVTITRDARGIPHVKAASLRDAVFALGYLHAQDRLFQMEMQRRIGQGRVAEIVGGAGLRIDRFIRTLGLYRRAKASLPYLKPETRRLLQAYTDGVNAWLRTRKGPLPPEFTLLGIDFAPWTPADTLVWGKTMAIQLSGNWRDEILRLRLMRALGAKAIAVLFPPYPGGGPVTIKDYKTGSLRGLPLDRLWAALPRGLISQGASNEWVVAGSKTASGKPILANDPHLGLSAPILWYLVRIDTPDVTLAGATVPGTPALILGHNRHIAWGLTTPYIDSDDVFIEKVDPNDPSKYLTPDGPKPFVTHKEVIKVRFGDDVTLTVRETRHGPVLPTTPPRGAEPQRQATEVLALSAPWLTTRDTSADAFTGLARVRNWDQFRAVLRRYIGPLQNFVYADTAGNIGYYVPGRIPIRKKGHGFLPAPGWSGDYDWEGFIPFDKLPQSYNPPSGVIVNANSKIVGKEYPYFLSREWGGHYRAARITTLLSETDEHTPQTIRAIQADVESPMARDLLPLMTAIKPADPDARAALVLLHKWDGEMRLDRREPLIFIAWLAELDRRLYGDELGKLADSFVGLRADVVKNILTHHRDWCNDRATKAKESCADILEASLEAALAMLRKRYGDDPALWRWGEAHFARFDHPVFAMIPGLAQATRLRIANGGGPYTINRGTMEVRKKTAPFADRHGPGYRGIYTLDDLDKSLFTIATGESGNPYSRFYGNLVRAWRDVHPWRLRPLTAADRRTAVGTLVLVPKPAP